MTETALMADVVMRRAMSMEYDDFYTGGGHMHIMLGGKLIDPPGECAATTTSSSASSRSASERSIAAFR